MKSHRGRAVAATALLAGTLLLGGCAGGSPQASMRAWQNMRYVWLVKGTEPLDVVDALVKMNEKDSWTTAATDPHITAGADPAVPPVLYLSSTSTCFDSAT